MDARFVDVDTLPLDPAFKNAVKVYGCRTFGQFVAAVPASRQEELIQRLGKKGETFRDLLKFARTNRKAFAELAGVPSEPQPKPAAASASQSATSRPVKPKADSSGSGRRGQGRPQRVYPSIEMLDPKLHEELHRFNRQATDAFRDLQFNGVTSLVSETDDQFAISMPRIHELFQKLFGYGEAGALSRIDGNYDEIFLVYSVYRARDAYDRRGMWYFLEDLGVRDVNHLARIKRHLYETLRFYGFPTIEAGDQAFHYMYTMLLNGGLNRVSWQELWGRTIVPLLRHTDAAGGAGQNVGAMIKRAAISEKGDALARFGIRDVATRVILKEGPEVSILPMLGEATGTAAEIVASSLGGLNTTKSVVLNAGSLSSLAMETLEETIGEIQERESRRLRRSKDGEGRPAGPFYTREPTVRLEDGEMHIQWYAMPMPRKFVGYKVEYWVNGELAHSTYVDPHLAKGKLEAIDIPIDDPFADDAISIEQRYLMPLGDGEEDSFLETGSRTYNVIGHHAQCFEFLKTSNGSIQLRKDGDRLRGRGEHEVFVLVKRGYELRLSRNGLILGEIAYGDAENPDAGYTIYECLVTQGVSYGIRSAHSGWTVEQWNESCSVLATRKRRIGMTEDRVDVYGIPLPAKPGAIDGDGPASRPGPRVADFSIYGLLEAMGTCVLRIACGSETVEVGDARRLLSKRDDGSLALSIPDELMDAMVGACRLEIEVDGATVFGYRFVRVPLDYVGLVGIEPTDEKRFRARYLVRASEPCEVASDASDGGVSLSEVSEGAFVLDADLAAPQTRIRVFGERIPDPISFDLQLAGIRLRVRWSAFEHDGGVPIFYTQWSVLRERRGLVRFRTEMRCRGTRYVAAELSGKPLARYALHNSENRQINPFQSIGNDILGDKAKGGSRRSLDLRAVFFVGNAEDAMQDVRFRPALGATLHLSDVNLDLDLPAFRIRRSRPKGSFESCYTIVFAKPLENDLFMVFRTDERNVSSANEFLVDLERGSDEVRLPDDVAKAYDLYCEVDLTVQVPDGIDNSMRYRLHR